MRESRCTILIVGGGTGGVAAALAASTMLGPGARVIMTEETSWVGGQITSQAVPADEHPWIEQAGCTRRYRQYREGVRQYYRDHYPLSVAARANPHLNPGQGFVSAICHEPRVGLAVLEAMLAPLRSAGGLEVRLHCRPVAAETAGDRVLAVTMRDLETGEDEVIRADYILDATELGDLLPLARVEYVSGAEAQAETGEPHAVPVAQPDNVQGFTWCFPMAYDPVGEHVIAKPAQYDFWRSYVPTLTPPWPGKLLAWERAHPHTCKPLGSSLFPAPGKTFDWNSLWLFRRIACRETFAPGALPHEVTLVNWPQNDYWLGNIIDQPAALVAERLTAAKQLSLSLLYWLQTEAPRHDGGAGNPGLYLRPDLTGTRDGLAMAPYIRESRRIRAAFTVTENHVGAEARGGQPAAVFADSVGVGCYRIDLHPSSLGNNYLDISALPFQIPLGALLPVRVENLLPACKNLGTTHITNGCYRLHPVEWNIGEAAGALAAFCVSKQVAPRHVLGTDALRTDYQAALEQQGVELQWPALHPV